MRKLIILITLGIFLFACNDGYETRKIVIKGKISKISKVDASRVRSSVNAYTLADAKKAMFFYGVEYGLFNINADGTFSGKAPTGTATVIVFLTEDNKFIGNLFAGGLNMLPLVGLSDDVSVIDLSSLTLEGTRVIPANDPIGNEIKLTDDELNFMKEVGAYYETLAKNIDTNNDGEPDLLKRIQLELNTVVNIAAGKWGVDNNPPELLATEDFEINYGLRIYGFKESKFDLETIQLTGPLNNPYNDIQKTNPNITPSGGFIVIFRHGYQTNFSTWAYNFLPFENGLYSVKLNATDERTFNYSNVNMRNYMVIIIPTLKTDNAGNLKSIAMEYKFPDGTPVDPHRLIIGKVRIDIMAKNNQSYHADGLYGSKNVSDYNYYEKIIEKPLLVSDIINLNLSYVDLLGNEYDFLWQNDVSNQK